MLRFIKNNLPNLLTCFNLVCGIIGIILISLNGIEAIDQVEWLIVFAGIADFFDGFVARLLKSTSPIGKDLDSLADGITFGVLPCLTSFHYLYSQETSGHSWHPYLAICIGVFSIIRLAIFNNDSRQSDSFIGVPTPANAYFLTFLVGGMYHSDFLFPISTNGFIGILLICSYLLISPLRLLALKFKNFSWSQNKTRFTLILLSVATLAFFGKIAVPIIFVYYVGLSVILKLIQKNAV
jgi:CDP-diacylglycerol---serine O-phosphatidyltransferase